MKLSRRSILHAGAVAPALAQSASTRPPNIVLMLSDDHSQPFLGCSGHPVVKTPVIDRLAGEGMRLTHAYTTAPQCVPSRAGIMTGRSPVAVRMGRFSSPLPPEAVTIPDVLRERGYYTGVCRRYFHLDGVANPNEVTRRVYEAHDMQTFKRRMDFIDRTGQRAQTPAVVDRFLGQVPQGRPFFFWVNFSDPHHVWDENAVPEPYDPAKMPVPGWLPDLPGVRHDLSRYCGEVARLDEEVGWVLDALKKRGLEENTIVVLMGDNGAALPRGKGSLYEMGCRVPLSFKWPGRIRPGQVSDALISGEDIAPTLIEAAGLKVPPVMSGRSFLPLLENREHNRRESVFTARLHHGNSPVTANTMASVFDLSRSVRTRTHRLIYNCTPHMRYQPVDSAKDPGWRDILAAHEARSLAPEFERLYFTNPRPVLELYDLEKDPHELENIAGRPGTDAVMSQLMAIMQEKMILDYDFLPPPMAL
jgi:arylsulfatase A-like enzyme